MTHSSKLVDRPDTFLGVCEAVGQDFGFHPNWLRIALAIGLLWQPWAIVSIYVALGVAVAVSRWLFPACRAQSAAPDMQQAEVAGGPAALAMAA